jgi:hypothetical protein
MNDVIISSLPNEIQKLIPLSIRSFKAVYQLNELPLDIQFLIKEYNTSSPAYTPYVNTYDILPVLNEYSDFTTVQNLKDLVKEYLKNYLLITPKSYPFDPLFGCKLKNYLQNKDTSLSEMLIGSEVNNVANVISADLQSSIQIMSITNSTNSIGVGIESNSVINLKIDGEPINLSMNVPING